MTLSVQELNALLEKCAALQKIIETQEESVRKVYLKRLQLCRNLYGQAGRRHPAEGRLDRDAGA